MKFILARIHPSWMLVAFAIGIFSGDIFILITRSTFFFPALWIAISLLLLFLAIIFPMRLTFIFALLGGVVLIGCRSAPEFIAEDYFNSLVGRTVTISGKISKDPTDSTSSGKLNLVLTDLKLLPSVSSDQKSASASSELQSLPALSSELQLASTPDAAISLSGTLFAQVQNVDVQRSDIIVLSGELSAGFGAYAASVFRPTVQSVSRPEPGDLFLKLRDYFAQGIKDYLPAKQAGLGLGFLLGQKSGVDQSFQDQLRTVGLTHIIVASGAHLGVVVSLARKIFGKISRFSSLLFALIFMSVFIGITGLSASMLRAGLVTILSLIAWYYGRDTSPARIILLVAAGTLLVNPSYLTDLAWLLSFASFSGILIVAPLLIKFFYGQNKKPGFLSSTLLSSLAAALLCTPILLYFFGSVSLISILANLLILPTVSIAMGLTFLTGVAAILLAPLANLVSKLALIILDYQISVVEFFGDKKMFLVEIEPQNPLVFLLYIPLVVALVIFIIFQTKSVKFKKH